MRQANPFSPFWVVQFRLKVSYIFSENDATCLRIREVIRNIIATKKVFACEAEERLPDFTTGFDFEVDFVDTIETSEDSYKRRFFKAKHVLATLHELEEVCKNN